MMVLICMKWTLLDCNKVVQVQHFVDCKEHLRLLNPANDMIDTSV